MFPRSKRIIAASTRIVVLAAFALCGTSVCAQTNLNLAVSSNNDNADETSGTVYINDNALWFGGSYYTGFRFQNVTIPAGATITSATLKLHSYFGGTYSFAVNVRAHDIDNSSAFSTSSSNISNRTRTTAQVAWSVSSQSFSSGGAVDSPNIASVVQEVVDRSGWASGNAMSIILTPSSGSMAAYAYYNSATYTPELSITYTTGSTGTVLLVTSGSTPNSEESARKTQFEGWGYTVNTIEDSASQASFDTAVASVDAVYVPSTIQDWELLYKLRTASCGVVTETPGLDTEFGFATSDGYTESQTAIYITDNTHEVSSGLTTGVVTIFSSTQTRALNGNTLAAGMTTLGMNASQNMLTLGVIDSGGALANTYNSNSTASGRRVRMPWGSITWSALNSNGLLIAQNALSWASGGGSSSSGGGDLLLVTGSSTLTSEESAKKVEFEGWGYTVTTIVDSDSQTNFDTAMAACDVVYVPQTASATDLGYKLRTAEIGIVQEGVNSFDDNMGWGTSTGQNTNTCTTMTVVDNTHPISEHFSTGTVSIFNSSTAHYGSQVVPTVASGADVLATNLCVNSGRANLLALDWNAALANTYNGNSTATGRRVRLPYGGGSTFTWSNLSSGGLTMVQKALEWAALPKLAGHWKFDEGTGTNIADSSGNDHDAAFNTGSPSWTTGVRGGALEFSGFNDADTDTTFDPPETGTVAFWFRFNSAPSGPQRLFGNDGNWEVRTDATGAIYCDISGDASGGGFYTAAGVAEAGVWHHLAAVYNCASDTYALYLDGEAVASGSMTLADISAATLSFGTRTGSTERFSGALDDLRVYNYELTQAEVAELYGLVGHWKLDETSGTVATDSSNIGNDATYWSGATPGAAGPYPGAGANAAVLDGVDDNIGASSIDAYDNITEYVSVAAWVRFDTALADQTNQQTILSRDSWSNKKGFILLANQPYSEAIIFRVLDGSSYADAAWTNPGLKADQWYHFVGTYDGTTVRLYVDGQLQASASFSSSIEPNTGDSVGMGYNMAGRLHDVRLYNRAISESEVAEIYGLVAWWKLDETSGTVAYDSSGMGNDAALTGTQGWTTEGQVDGGFAFDYTDGEEYFEAPSNTLLDNLQETDYSVAAWFKPNSVPAGSGADYNASYAPLSKTGYHLGLCYGNGQNFYNEHWLQTGPSWAGAGTWYDTYPPGTFHHVAAVICSTDGTIKVFLDGQLKETVTFTAGETSWEYGSNLWHIGVSQPGMTDWGHPCDGVVDDARLYNRALSDDEVYQVYKSGAFNGIRIIRWVEVR